ncbi:beta-1,3-galactosyltransferase 1-like [Montipora capricornis]|uniref:beta-1,3-galactosyltransferase 1-like n=1 Tax=Montipora foliosa TaxID=591990 RepID=UPI0035F10F37
MPCRIRKRNAVWFGIGFLVFYLLFSYSQRSDSYDRSRLNFNSNRLKVQFDDVRNKRQANSSIMVSDVYSSCSQLNFSFPSVVVEPSFSVQESNLFIFVLVTSGVSEKFSENRDAIRNTWLKQHDASVWWRHTFVLGSADNRDGPSENEIKREAELYNDILQFSSIDNYHNLVIKVLSGLRWAVTQVNPRFILKTDDDVYIRLPHLMLWLRKFGKDRFYGGAVRGGIFLDDIGPLVARYSGANPVSFDCYPEYRFPRYTYGAFYVLSSAATESLLQNMRRWKVFPVEDAYVGVLARDSGLKPVDIPGFKIAHPYLQFFYHRCTWRSLVAMGHTYRSSHLYYVERKLQETDQLNLSTNFCDVYETLTNPFLVVFTCFVVVFAVIVKVIRRERNLLNLCRRVTRK